MKNRILQGGDSYPGHLAGIKGGQLRSHQFSSEVRRTQETEYQTESYVVKIV
jgi:hypothetical protein